MLTLRIAVDGLTSMTTHVGDSFEYENLKVRVTKADGKRALEVNIVVKQNEEQQPEGEKR